jgi:hypothetical protein
MMPSPRKRRLPKWMAMALLGLLAATLAALFGALYLLYWMTAPAPLASAERMVLPAASFRLVCNPDMRREAERAWLRGMLHYSLRQAPTVVARAAEYAFSPERAPLCPLRAGVSGRCREDAIKAWVAVVSMGRYRGAFWLADREVYRLARDGRIPYGMRRHGDTRFYERTQSAVAGPPVLALWRATALAGSDAAGVGEVYDLLAGGAGGPDRAEPARRAFAEGFVADPAEALPAVSGDALSRTDARRLGGLLSPFSFTLDIGDDGALAADVLLACRDSGHHGPLAEDLRGALQRAKEQGRIESLDVAPGERGVRVQLRWRAPWAGR